MRRSLGLLIFFVCLGGPAWLFCACSDESASESEKNDGDAFDAPQGGEEENETYDMLAACNPDNTDPDGPACSLKVETDAQFDALSIGPTGIQYWERATKYMVPALDDSSLISPLVQNANRYSIHMEFLTSVFMPNLDMSAYMNMITKRATRKYYAGNLARINDPQKGIIYGFTAYTAAKMSEVLEPVEARRIYDQLKKVVTAGSLAFTFEPFDAMGPEKAKAWISPGFPIYFPQRNEVKIEVYTSGVNYGYVRRFTLDQFEAVAGTLHYRDIPIIESVPFDIEDVVAAVVTGERQWELSHVNVRMGRRGTPNLYVQAPLDAFSEWNDKLVRLEARKKGESDTADSYVVTEASLADAEAWWAAHRPKLENIPEADKTYTAFDSLTAMDVDDTPARLITHFGGKTTNLAKLYAFLTSKYQVPGFGIPFAHFEAFLDATTIFDERHSPSREVTLRQYVNSLSTDSLVASDATYRRNLLAGLRDRIETGGTIPIELVQALATRIDQVFGGTDIRVRFRSSSNIEDGLEFSGAGLYDSTTVCADDSLDADTAGPCACDSTESKERSIERGLRQVWASLYNDRAWEERDYYQVPQTAASMAILVSLGFPDELANGVAFTGDPSDAAEKRYLINAQIGDEKVVSNDPSKIPEKDYLEITSGEVTDIYRVRSSTLATPGVPVLSDDQLKELGALMASIHSRYPVDLDGHRRDDILMDIEFKIQKGTNQLKLKQIRPFLMATTEK